MEDEEIKQLLRRNLELARENNKLLKKIRRNGIVANVIRIIWWGVFIGVPIFLYYFVLEPYLIEIATTYQNLQNSVNGAQNAVLDIPFIGDLLERYANDAAEGTPSE